MRRINALLFLVLAFLYGGNNDLPLAHAEGLEPIEVMIFERPPYYVVQPGGAVTGIVAKPAENAFKEAGVDFKWDIVAANRQLKIIKENSHKTCAVGWFKKPEREEFSKFTVYIHQNKPLVALTRSDNARMLGHKTLKGLFLDKKLIFGSKLGFSYGDLVDKLIKETNPVTITSSRSNVGLARMMLRQRFDYMLAAYEEAEVLVNSMGGSGGELAIRSFEEIPDGNKRYILCSKKVSDETIGKLNAAIKKLAR